MTVRVAAVVLLAVAVVTGYYVWAPPAADEGVSQRPGAPGVDADRGRPVDGAGAQPGLPAEMLGTQGDSLEASMVAAGHARPASERLADDSCELRAVSAAGTAVPLEDGRALYAGRRPFPGRAEPGGLAWRFDALPADAVDVGVRVAGRWFDAVRHPGQQQVVLQLPPHGAVEVRVDAPWRSDGGAGPARRVGRLVELGGRGELPLVLHELVPGRWTGRADVVFAGEYELRVPGERGEFRHGPLRVLPDRVAVVRREVDRGH